jgi:cell division protein FtsB
MPSTRHATAAPRADAAGARATRRPRRVAGRPPIHRVRWDRVGRVALVITLAVVAGLYVQHALAYLEARAQADQQQEIVKRLIRDNAALTRRQHALNDPTTIVRDARALGMVWQGERPYSVTGLPNH